jgi:hypothetical protein
MNLQKSGITRTACLAAATSFLLCNAWISGCDSNEGNPLVPSLQPVYHDTDLNLDSGLLGTWLDEQDDVKLVFDSDEPQHGYKLVIADLENNQEMRGEFTAHLLRLKSDWLLDLYPNDLENGPDVFKSHFVKAHSFVRINRDGGKLHWTMLSSDWLEARLADKTVDTPHETFNGGVLLTGNIDELQELVYRYADDSDAFSIAADFVKAEVQSGQEQR